MVAEDPQHWHLFQDAAVPRNGRRIHSHEADDLRRVADAMQKAGADLSASDRRALAAACERAETFDGLPVKWRERIVAMEKA